MLLASVLAASSTVVMEKRPGRLPRVVPGHGESNWPTSVGTKSSRVKRASSGGTCGLGNNTLLEISPVKKGKLRKTEMAPKRLCIGVCV